MDPFLNLSTQGIKPGVVMSGYLFNFIMDFLLQKCIGLNIGALIGKNNVSCLAYCDYILLLSPVKSHMNI